MTTTSGSRSTAFGRRLPMAGVALAVALSGGGVVLVGASGSASADAATSQYGTLSAPNGALPAHHQCGTYSYAVTVTPPAGNWAIETSVIDPRGVTMASGTLIEDYNTTGPTTALTYQLCTNSTTSGTFTLTGKFTVDDGTGTITTTQMAPALFKLTKPPHQVSKRKLLKSKAERAKKAKQQQKRKNSTKNNKSA